MNILERIEALEDEVRRLRIIDSEDITPEETGDGTMLHLEDPFAGLEEGDTYNGYFKVIQTAADKIKIVDGFADDLTIYQYAGNALINDMEYTNIAAAEFTITTDSWIYLISTGSAPTLQLFTSRQIYELGKSKTLISRVKFVDGKITKFSREVHGPITGYIDGECE